MDSCLKEGIQELHKLFREQHTCNSDIVRIINPVRAVNILHCLGNMVNIIPIFYTIAICLKVVLTGVWRPQPCRHVCTFLDSVILFLDFLNIFLILVHRFYHS